MCSCTTGPPQLMMAFTADGQLQPELLAGLDEATGKATAERRAAREDIRPEPELPHPAADHCWNGSGRAWQVVMQEVDFKGG